MITRSCDRCGSPTAVVEGGTEQNVAVNLSDAVLAPDATVGKPMLSSLSVIVKADRDLCPTCMAVAIAASSFVNLDVAVKTQLGDAVKSDALGGAISVNGAPVAVAAAVVIP